MICDSEYPKINLKKIDLLYFICQGCYVWSCYDKSDWISELPYSHIGCRDISCLYDQISDELQDDLSQLLDSHTLDIRISGPYEQISDEFQG